MIQIKQLDLLNYHFKSLCNKLDPIQTEINHNTECPAQYKHYTRY